MAAQPITAEELEEIRNGLRTIDAWLERTQSDPQYMADDTQHEALYEALSASGSVRLLLNGVYTKAVPSRSS